MTQNKAYNLRVYCKLKNIDTDSESGKEFLTKTILEQLTIIKALREEPERVQEPDPDPEQEQEQDFSILGKLFKK